MAAKKPTKRLQTRRTVSVPPEMFTTLERLAQEEGIPCSQFVTRLLTAPPTARALTPPTAYVQEKGTLTPGSKGQRRWVVNVDLMLVARNEKDAARVCVNLLKAHCEELMVCGVDKEISEK